MISGELWCWTSPVWLLIAAWLASYVLMVRGSRRFHWLALLLGFASLGMAFVSPLGVLADGYLFSAHMVQHLILLLVVPGCILLSLPADNTDGALHGARWDRIGRFLATPQLGWICGVGAMWFWHIPWLCSTAALRPGFGFFRDATLVVAGLIFWWPIYAPRERYRLHPLSGCIYLFSACLGCTLLGIYITFAPLSVCPVFANPTDRIGVLNAIYDAGLTPGIDQRLGGLIMWVPPCLLYTGAIIGLLSRWYTTAKPNSLGTFAAKIKEA